MRMLAILFLTSALLSGCTSLHSEEPLYSAADEVGAPRLKDGVWRVDSFAADLKCRVHEASRLGDWPTCSEWWLIRGGEFLERDRTDDAGWTAASFILARGEPRILQTADAGGEPFYSYSWLSAPRLDRGGHIVGMAYNGYICPTRTEEADETAEPKPALSDGETILATCEVKSKAALLEFLRSPNLTASDVVGPIKFKWVRAVDPHDFAKGAVR